MSYVLQPGDVCWRCDLDWTRGYHQYTWAAQTAEVESLMLFMNLPTVPYAVISGRGEIWVCYDELFNDWDAAYEFVAFYARTM